MPSLFFVFFLSPLFITNRVTCGSTTFTTTITALTPKAFEITTAILAFETTTNLTLESRLLGILDVLRISSDFSLSMTTAALLPSSVQLRLPAARGNYQLGARKQTFWATYWAHQEKNLSSFLQQHSRRLRGSSCHSTATSLPVSMANHLLPAICWLCKLSFDPSPDLKIATLDSNLPFHLLSDLALQESRLPSILDIPIVSSAFSFSATTTAFLRSSALFQHTAAFGYDKTGGSRTNILGYALDDVELELGVRRRGQRSMPGGAEGGGGGFEGWDGGDGGRRNGDDHDDIIRWLVAVICLIVIVIVAIVFLSLSQYWGDGSFLF